jgi:hypothetical protein
MGRIRRTASRSSPTQRPSGPAAQLDQQGGPSLTSYARAWKEEGAGQSFRVGSSPERRVNNERAGLEWTAAFFPGDGASAGSGRPQGSLQHQDDEGKVKGWLA